MLSVLAVAALAVTPAFAETINVPERDPKVLADAVGKVVTLLASIGAAVVVGSLIWNGYRLATSSGAPAKREAAVTGLLWTCVAGVVVFGAYYLAGVLKGFVAGL